MIYVESFVLPHFPRTILYIFLPYVFFCIYFPFALVSLLQFKLKIEIMLRQFSQNIILGLGLGLG